MATNRTLKRIGASVALLMLCIPAAAASLPSDTQQTSATPSPERIDKQLKQGQDSIRKGEYDHAIAFYQDALTHVPDSAPAKLGLSWAELKSHDYVSSSRAAWEVLQKDPDNARALALLGMCFMRVGLLNEAYSSFKRALQLDNSQALATAGLAEIALYMGSFGESLNLIRRAVELDGSEPDFIFLHGHI